jgi:hypothetical protein
MTYDRSLTARADSLDGKLAELLVLAENLRRQGQADNAIEAHRLWMDITEAVADLRKETR